MRLGSAEPFASLAEAWNGFCFLAQLPFFLRHPGNPEEALRVLARRLHDRPARFRALLKKLFSPSSTSPYKNLLSWAGGCTSDVMELAVRNSVEETLKILYRQGIYLTVEEFKGRSPVRRGSRQMHVHAGMFLNPTGLSGMTVQTSGSRNARIPVPLTLDYVRSRAIDALANLQARRGLDWVHGLWGIPGSSALAYLLEMAGTGRPPVRWFSPVDPASPALHPRYRWSSRLIRLSSLMAGVSLPRLIPASLERPEPILRWLKETIKVGDTPHLFTYVTSALRLSQAAAKEGVDISGAHFTVTGEPLTEIRAQAIRKSGADVYPRYGSAESGTIGYGCLNPSLPDDMHLLEDRLALVQTDKEKNGIPEGTLLVTCLEPSSPYFLLNMSLGDVAIVEDRDCGCPMRSLGWRTHLHSIRSYEKLTSEGMTFLRTDLEKVLDEVLPGAFGGGPGDYQLLEEESADGKPSLRLLVHPAAGQPDPEHIISVFLTALSAGRGAEKIMGMLWQEARLLRVDIKPPIATDSGKVLHLHHRLSSAIKADRQEKAFRAKPD